jgi:hypothetical protein
MTILPRKMPGEIAFVPPAGWTTLEAPRPVLGSNGTLVVETWEAWRAPDDTAAQLVFGCVGMELHTWTPEANPIALEHLRATVGATLIRMDRPATLHATREARAGVVTEQWLDSDEENRTSARTFLGFVAEGSEPHVVGCFLLCATHSAPCDVSLRLATPTNEFVAPPEPTAPLRALVLAVHHSQAVALGAVLLFFLASVVAVWQRPGPGRK